MLSIPEYGWVDVSIGNWIDRASYLTDPHLDLMDAFINLLNNKKVSAVNFDAEGWEYIIVLDLYSSYVIDSKEERPQLYNFDISANILAEELYKDISNNLYKWSVWDCVVETEKIRLEKEVEIKNKLQELRNAIDSF